MHNACCVLSISTVAALQSREPRWHAIHNEHGYDDHVIFRRSCPQNASAKQLIFIHIPKTGGESLEKAWDLPKNHHLASERRHEVFSSAGRRDDVFVATIIRNPYDRMWSWFRYCLQKDGWYVYHCPVLECKLAVHLAIAEYNERKLMMKLSTVHESLQLEEAKTVFRSAFSEWLIIQDTKRIPNDSNLTDEDEKLVPQLGDPEKSCLHGSTLTNTITDWLVDPKTREVMPDFTIRFESYEEDFVELNKCLGAQKEVPHENAASSTESKYHVPVDLVTALSSMSWKEAYKPDALQVVRRWFTDDFDAAGYSKDI